MPVSFNFTRISTSLPSLSATAVSQSGCVEDAKEVARLVEEKFPKLDGAVEINYVGTTIGSHTGPGTVALFFWGKERTE